jgi:23S rRNA maturation mini-RNase III
MTPRAGGLSPHHASVREMAAAVERAKQAESQARALKNMCEALDHQNKTYQAVRRTPPHPSTSFRIKCYVLLHVSECSFVRQATGCPVDDSG